jgi:Uma2 family endonuclease
VRRRRRVVSSTTSLLGHFSPLIPVGKPLTRYSTSRAVSRGGRNRLPRWLRAPQTTAWMASRLQCQGFWPTGRVPRGELVGPAYKLPASSSSHAARDDLRRREAIENPVLLVEVLSESTEAYDRGAKAAHYRRIPSLEEYVLVSRDEPLIEVFRRSGQHWELYECRPGGRVELTSVGVQLEVDAVYAGQGKIGVVSAGPG